ncbi:MAG: SPOR domain-containing protein [Puia sp.]|nr:SPOR domain-containing protein [Puia sp.]
MNIPNIKNAWFLPLLLSGRLLAQTDSSAPASPVTVITIAGPGANTSAAGTVVVHKDPRIETLIKKQAQINEVTTRDSRRNVPGFRIQVIQSRDRNKVFAEKTKIYQQFPDLQPYLVYQQPYYKLKVGNFKTQEEAEDFQKQLTKLFPTGLFVVRDIIDVKPD